MADNGIESKFKRDSVLLKMEGKNFLIGSGQRDTKNRMYMLPEPVNHSHLDRALNLSSYATDLRDLWHKRLAHINQRDLSRLHKHVDGVPKLSKSKDICRACRLGKAHKLPFPGNFEIADHVGEVVHSDIVGELEPSFPDRFRYVTTFLDGHSRYTFIGLMRYKSDLTEVFEGVAKMFRNIGGASIKKLHSDGAKEYLALQNSLGGGEDDKSFSPPYTPELNRIAERVNRTMVEGALSTSSDSCGPES